MQVWETQIFIRGKWGKVRFKQSDSVTSYLDKIWFLVNKKGEIFKDKSIFNSMLLYENFGIFFNVIVKCPIGPYGTNCESRCLENMFGKLCIFLPLLI